MAMLAERKRKQKWSLNPRGKEWSEDTNKFGQKMLEKMGWKSGKGLGANLDGMTEHVKLAYKLDNKGMGYKENGDQWTEHDEKFSELLKSLGKDCAVEVSDVIQTSLEEISANSKRRVHYRKFTKGKDLSQYSEKQLANIFGKKTLKHKKSDDEIDNISLESPQKEFKKYGVDTVEAGSMVDYFKNKLGGKFSSKRLNDGWFEIGNNGVLKKVESGKENWDCESEAELERPSFGLGFNDNFESNISRDTTESVNSIVATKKNKKRKFKKDVETVYDNAVFNNSLNDQREISEGYIEENPYEVKPKEKKIKRDVSSEEIKIPRKLNKKKVKQMDIDTTIVTSDSKTLKIKKKKNNKVSPINEEESTNIAIKIKKKKSKKIANDDSLSNGNVADVETTLPSNTPRKKNKNKNKILPMEDCTSEEMSPKKKLKKQKNEGLENPNFEPNESPINFSDVSNEFEVTRKMKKTKKTKKSNGLDNPGLNVSNLTDNSYQEGLSTSIQQNLYEGIENLALNISANDSAIIGAGTSDDVIEYDLMLNVAGLPSSAQKEQKPVERRKSVRFSESNQEFIIPSNYENKLLARLEGLANAAFDERLTTMEENMLDIEHHLSTDCAKVENDLNEVRAAAHARLLVPIIQRNANVWHGNAGINSLPEKKERKGKTDKIEEQEDFPEVGENDSSQTNISTPNGDVRLSYKLAPLKVINLPSYMRNLPKNSDRAAYKHLIRGDIILGFKKSNLHEIVGYGTDQSILKDVSVVDK